MKRILTSLITSCMIFTAAIIHGEPQSATIDPGHQEDTANLTDSVQMVMTLSEESEGQSFFNGVIPPSPQASALARYAEYPVSHTTGIPDISIPLYVIDLGGFTLPISISYHASGARPDEMPTCVGLGWTLNAGGAISRTVLGKPDMYFATASATDYRYFDAENIRSMLAEISATGGGTQLNSLHSIITDSSECDTESDRYTYNVVGKTGVFRYSYLDGRFIVLNNSNDRVTATGSSNSDSGIRFSLMSTDGIDYEFAHEESSGALDCFNGGPFTSSWYLTKISTPFGDITFSYTHCPSVDVTLMDSQATAGPRPKYIDDGSFEWTYTIQSSQSGHTVSYGQEQLSKIEWNGNRIEFIYTDENPGKTLRRLTAMKVYNSTDELRKTVTFDNTDNWPTNSNLTGRRLLKSVNDSQEGLWNFEYSKTWNLPALPLHHPAASMSDYWGYMNASASSSSTDVFTASQSQWLNSGIEDCTGLDSGTIDGFISGRDRSPSLAHTKSGVLRKITSPTGLTVEFDYELNQYGNRKYGGLRLKSQTVREIAGEAARVTSYSYSGTYLTAEDPEDLMRYISHELFSTQSLGVPVPQEFRTVVTSPISAVTSSSGPIVYLNVTETRNDGSSIFYTYDDAGLSSLPGIDGEKVHPSLYGQSRYDFGCRQPLLTSKSVFGSDGAKVYEETYTYDKIVRRIFSTGVRTVCPYMENNSGSGVTDAYNVAHFGMLQYSPSYAHVLAHVLTSKTATETGTGFSAVTSFTYDESFRTMQPRSESVIGSGDEVIRTVYSFPFDKTDPVSISMTEEGFVDFHVEKATYSGQKLIARTATKYDATGKFYLPHSISFSQAPTSSSISSSLTERERVTAYNSKGRPLSIKANETDETSFTWDTTGCMLLSSTSPGGLTTTYTHRPLFGLSSVTSPAGRTISYSYNAAGMLVSESDNSGRLASYSYSIAGHPSMNSAGNSVTTSISLDAAGSNCVTARQYLNAFGQPSTLASGGINTSGSYVYTATGYDALGRECSSVLPGAGGNSLSSLDFDAVKSLSVSSNSDSFPYSETTYDALDRPVWTSTPGSDWHEEGQGKTTEYLSNAKNSVRRYIAPMDSISLVKAGYYEEKTLQGVRTVDEDGKEMTVYTDRLGRKVLERRGSEKEKGMNDTYFVYNDLGQLRYVLTPDYQSAGYKDKYAYEYRYDKYGNVVKKFIPGAVYTQYWYDRSGRMTFMQDGNLRANNLYRFFIYDKAGRLVIQGVAGYTSRDETVNFATYTGNGGFMSTGYTLVAPSKIKQVTLETVAYYDSYGFTGILDQRLAKTGTASAAGLRTGSVAYTSDGGKTMSAFYYDIRGNVIENREITAFGTQRVTSSSYTYSGKPLKTTITEGDLTVVTQNTYHTSSDLLLSTDVTVKGITQRVADVTYDNLGRIASVTRGAGANSGGTVRYAYNLHGQTTSITGPGFSQRLYYTDGPGTPLYNGSVSSMKWTMGAGQYVRGYKYSYNAYNWLLDADYGEGSSLDNYQNRYNEKILNFTRNGGIKRMQRYGLKADSQYGMVDNLNINYSGNRITSVTEYAEPVTQNGSMDYPGIQGSMYFGYNDFGSLVSDGSRGIDSIAYNNLGNPVRISYSGGNYTENVYSATGEKLKTTHSTGIVSPLADLVADTYSDEQPDISAQSLVGVSETEYHGNVIYKDGVADMVLFSGGYVTLQGGVTFHYYTQDYLGNNRAVINGSTGAIEQLVSYYPFGGVIPGLSTDRDFQQYKFGGKELITANGLNEYDFGARLYYSAVPHFTSIDPLCEKYYWLSPYVYCANNPVNFVDPTGKDVTVWATTLPGASDNIKKFRATHTFITVCDKNNNTYYFAYGSSLEDFNSMVAACTGKLERKFYSQDKRIFSKNEDDPDLKAKIQVDPPEGMTQDDFDKAVVDAAISFGNQEGISYLLYPISDITGNCNSSTSTILFKAGVTKEKICEIKKLIPGIKWGFGDIKPWTETEQTDAMEKYKISNESLQNSLP